MSTIVCNLNSIIASCDTLVVKFDKLREIFQPIVKEAGTNWQDVSIVFLICTTFVIIAYFAKNTILGWQNNKIQAAKQERDDKKTKEEEESKRKHQSDLLDKKIEFLKELCYKIEERIETKEDGKENKKYEKVLKDSDSPEVKRYIDALDNKLKS